MFRNITDSERITMKVPPAWIDVVIAESEKNKVLVKGVDSKGKIQYIYNEKWIMKADKNKFVRIKKLIKDLPNIKRRIRKKTKDKKANIIFMSETH